MWSALWSALDIAFLRVNCAMKVMYALLTNTWRVLQDSVPPHPLLVPCQVKDFATVNFDARALLQNIVQIYLNLAPHDTFCRAVCLDERSYSPDIFEQTQQTLRCDCAAMNCYCFYDSVRSSRDCHISSQQIYYSYSGLHCTATFSVCEQISPGASPSNIAVPRIY